MHSNASLVMVQQYQSSLFSPTAGIESCIAVAHCSSYRAASMDACTIFVFRVLYRAGYLTNAPANRASLLCDHCVTPVHDSPLQCVKMDHEQHHSTPRPRALSNGLCMSRMLVIRNVTIGVGLTDMLTDGAYCHPHQHLNPPPGSFLCNGSPGDMLQSNGIGGGDARSSTLGDWGDYCTRVIDMP